MGNDAKLKSQKKRLEMNVFVSVKSDICQVVIISVLYKQSMIFDCWRVRHLQCSMWQSKSWRQVCIYSF